MHCHVHALYLSNHISNRFIPGRKYYRKNPKNLQRRKHHNLISSFRWSAFVEAEITLGLSFRFTIAEAKVPRLSFSLPLINQSSRDDKWQVMPPMGFWSNPTECVMRWGERTTNQYQTTTNNHHTSGPKWQHVHCIISGRIHKVKKACIK